MSAPLLLRKAGMQESDRNLGGVPAFLRSSEMWRVAVLTIGAEAAMAALAAAQS